MNFEIGDTSMKEASWEKNRLVIFYFLLGVLPVGISLQFKSYIALVR